jgi:hypothetical protein
LRGSAAVRAVLDAYDEARKFLAFETEIAPVPRDTLVNQIVAEGYDQETADDAVTISIENGDLVRINKNVVVVENGRVVESEGGLRPSRDRIPGQDKERSCSSNTCSVFSTTGGTTPYQGDRVLEAFETCVEFYHEHLDDELPDEADVDADTAREYFEDLRGWDADTVDERRLGYAPAGHGHDLLDRLMSEGFTRDEILGTGLFYDLGTPHFEGRLVFPYFDDAGRPCYAISRTSGHPDDKHGDQKYTKAQLTPDYSRVDEPIYGLDTVDDETETVLVAEGMPDAITAHELGYAAVSPVTTQFKGKHHAPVLDAVENADRVVVVADNDPVGSDLTEEEDLETTQYGDGLKGALRTADFLVENDVDARVAVPPVVARHDNDLDEYVHGDWGTVEKLVAGAKRPSQFDAYNDIRDSREEAVARARETLPDDEERDTSHTSNIYDLRLTDVIGVSEGYRGENPLGHDGGSRKDYFVVIDDRVAWDHKRKKAYNPITALLVEAGTRPVTRPDRRLDDAEVFEAWRYAKEHGLVDEDDRIPRRALRHVARDTTEWDGELVEHETRDGETFNGLPTDVYNAALDHVEEDLGLPTGKRYSSRDGHDDSVKPEAVLPHSPKARLITNGWDWTRDGRRGEELRNRIRERTTEKIAEAYEHGDRVLLEAIPTSGKSYGAVEAALQTDEDVTILTERRDLYDQIKDWCREHGLTSYTLPAFHRDCPTANGTHGDDEAERVRDLRRRGATPKEIHANLDVPCQEDGACHYSRRWDFDADEYDVLIGNYRHAHVDSAVSGRAVVFDEDTGGAFETVLEGAAFKSAVTQYLQNDDAVPFDDFTELLENRDDEIAVDATLEAVGEPEWRPSDVFEGKTTHAGAELAVYGLLKGEDLGNGLERATLPDDAVAVFNRETTTFGILRPPSLEYARSIVALDGTPTLGMWRARLGENLNHDQVLTDEERREYITTALNHRVIPTTPHVKPYSSERNVTVEKDEALLREVNRANDRDPALITTKTAREKYGEEDVLDHTDGVKHHGNMKGSNDFEDKRLGVIIGSRHFGDGYVKKWGAYLGDAVESPDRSDEENRGVGLSYGETGDKILKHMREHETVQALMRFGRDGNGAVIYVHTNTLPSWYPTETETPDDDAVVRPRSEAERDVIRELRRRGEGRTAELSEAVDDVTRRRVLQILNRLKTRGVVDATVDGRGYVWHDDGLHRVNDAGDVDLDTVDLDELPDEEVHEIGRSSTYTASFVNSDGSHASKAGEATPDASRTPRRAETEGSGPSG